MLVRRECEGRYSSAVAQVFPRQRIHSEAGRLREQAHRHERIANGMAARGAIGQVWVVDPAEAVIFSAGAPGLDAAIRELKLLH